MVWLCLCVVLVGLMAMVRFCSIGWVLLPIFAGLMMLTSCRQIGDFAERRADRAAYGIVEGAQRAALGEAKPFTIDAEESALIRELLSGAEGAAETLSLAEALVVAVANNRSYQRRKEELFIQALRLSETLKDYSQLDYSASANARTSLSTYRDGTQETFGEQGATLDAVASATTRMLATGARMTLAWSGDVLRYATNPDTHSSANGVSFNIVQPLLNGFGPLVSREPLRQAEREMVYAVRDFKRYQQGFVIGIAQEYFDVLKGRDQLENERKNYESAVNNRKQSEEFAKAGRIPEFEVAQARQRELTAADRWTLATANYQKQLDDFRYTLALPVGLDVRPDPKEFDVLTARGLVELSGELEDALAVAVSNRLDLVTQRERVEDRERKVEIARRDFLPGLDVGYTVEKNLGYRNRKASDVADVRQNFSVGLDLPLDWTERRNAYRIAQINLEQERRKLAESESDVQRTVRDLWRKLERSRLAYKNRLLSVELANRQVESTTMLLKMGRAKTRDQLEAQDDLLSARNDVTTALVDYTINRLRFWNAIECFEIDPEGMWYEQDGDAATQP